MKLNPIFGSVKGGVISGLVGGNEDPKKPSSAAPLTPQQRIDWNRYVDYVEKRGYKGSTQLDKKETGLAKKLFDDFIKENPNSSINYDHVKSVQIEMQKLKEVSQSFAKRRNNPDAEKIMAGISQVDGWPGSKTTQFKFPEMKEKYYHNEQLVKARNLGLVGSSLQPANQTAKPLPKGVKLEQLSDGVYYEDPSTGDMVKYR